MDRTRAGFNRPRCLRWYRTRAGFSWLKSFRWDWTRAGSIGTSVSDGIGPGQSSVDRDISAANGNTETGNGGRDRLRNPDLWKGSIAKRRRNSGKML